MSRQSRRAVAAGAACAAVITVGAMFWPDLSTEPGAPFVTTGFAQNSTQLAPQYAQRAAQRAQQPTPERLAEGRSIATQLSEAFEAAADRVAPSVVPIYAEKTMQVPGDVEELFRRFFGDRMPDGGGDGDGEGEGGGNGMEEQTLQSVGSGVIARADGYIITNNHVVADAERLTVILENGTRYTAKVVGTDPPTDLAVIQIDEKNLPVADFGTSDNLRVGQWVIAVGNPFRLLQSVTAGIVSATGRSAIGLATYEDFIQTDASINPGNSGGALADLDGKVIGINTAISSATGSSAGVGFAIPINMAKQVMDELINEGSVTRGYLAILPQDITPDLQKALHLSTREGALVGGVTGGGPADKGGMKRGDIIVEFNGDKVTNSNQLRDVVARANPGKSSKVVVIRDGKRKTLKVTPAERPAETAEKEPDHGKQEEPPSRMQQEFGLAAEDLTPTIASQLGVDGTKGALVVRVQGGSAAAEAGLARGDVILEVNGDSIDSARDLEKALRKVGSNDSVALLVQRGENTFYAPLSHDGGDREPPS